MEKVVRQKLFFSSDILLSVILSVFVASLYFKNEFIIAATFLLVIAAVVHIAKTISKKQKLSRPKPWVYYCFSVYLVRLIWLLFSNDPHYGLKWIDTCLPFVFLPLIFQWLPLNERILKTVFTFFVRCSFLYCIVMLFSVLYHACTVPIDIMEWIRSPKDFYPMAYAWTNYAHPSYLCVIYILALPVGLYLMRTCRAVSFMEWILLFVVEIMTIILTGARIGMIALPAISLFMILYVVPKGRKVLVTIIMAVFLLLMGYWLISASDNIKNRFKDPVREQLFETAIYSIKEKPLLGLGTGGMKAVIQSPEVAEKLNYPDTLPLSYPHNQYLGEVMQFGAGAVALFAMLLYLMVAAFRRRNFLLQSLLFILVIFMLTEMPFDSNKGINYALFFSSLFLSMSRKNTLTT